MSSSTTVTVTRRRQKWHNSQPPPPTPRILHFPRRPRTRLRVSKNKFSDIPSSCFDKKGKLEALFDQERTFLKEGVCVPVVLLDHGGDMDNYKRRERVEERERESESGCEEKWRFQAEMLRAECNLLRMEREITNKKLDKMKIKMEGALRSAVQALVSGRNKIYEGRDMEMVLKEEIDDLVRKLERLRRCSRVKDRKLRKCSNFDKRVSLLEKKLGKNGGGIDEVIVTEMRETTEATLLTKEACKDHETCISSGKLNVEILSRKMEDLSKGTLLERMREECKSMLSVSTASSSSVASSASSSKRIEVRDFSMSKQLAKQDSTSKEENLCSGHCKMIIRRIIEQVQAEKDQWSQMQEMLGQVREEMEELQVSREFWKDRAFDSERQIQSLHSSVEEWRQKAITNEIKVKELERGKNDQVTNSMRAKCVASPNITDAPDHEMEKHVLICRVKEKTNYTRDVRNRRQEISISNDEQRKNHSQIRGLKTCDRLPFRDIGNSSTLMKNKLGSNFQLVRDH